MKRILLLLCALILVLSACVAQSEPETTNETTTTESTAIEMTGEATTTVAATSKSSTTAAMPKDVLLPFDGGGTLIWDASNISNAYVEYTKERTQNYACLATFSSKNTQALFTLLNEMNKTLVETEIHGMNDSKQPFKKMKLERGGKSELYFFKMDTPEYTLMSVYQKADCGYIWFRRDNGWSEDYTYYYHSLYQISLNDLQSLERFFEGLEKHQETLMAKPAIYLYPKTPTQVNVTLAPRNGYFTETIPAYNNGWHVLARPSGQLTNLADGKAYPYLFWEAVERDPWPEPRQGFIVARDDLEAFLREKLAFMGLIPVEYEEFIEFWLPLLQKNAYSLIYFAGEEYAARFPLKITPAPDSLLRVFMVARPTTGKEKIAPQALRPFTRAGFAAIEWGGTLLD